MEHELGKLLAGPLEPIRTARLVLRPPRADDAPAIAALANDFGVAEMLAHVPHPYMLADAEDFLGVAGSGVVFAVTRGGDGVFMGVCGLRPTPRPAVADLGYWLGRPFWGRGYATEAAHAVVDLAFRLEGITSVLAGCRAVNGRSRRVLEKCGFQFRGTGTFVSRAAGRVSSENFGLERRTWMALRSWGREGAEA
ncbi:GNAT family N-acetyltransferase [Aureimonas leprariae]|uniref:GNAT family N-acetyltransferase n=1 Tax=Plantimonas leprariae TaxID=2615207 RepID=A0A7V7PRG4_9HYPH|nr:GNAT family N-acetyltransferase [Aureimonas leprariae]KAB0681301.1 GNAT family N-acetyltransferase [Aureimonas leprariae]